MMSSRQRVFSICLWLTLAGVGGFLCLTAGLYLYLSPKLPTVEALREVKLQTPLRVFSSDNKLIGEFGEMHRNPLSFEQIPPLFVHALLAAEDDRFYKHSGVDLKGLLRAASQLLTTGQIQTGGSTITMQVARNFFLTSRQTFTRKFNEILLARRIEKELSKEEILTLYANKIFLGNRAYGIEAAAQVYYGKPIADLNLAQLAMIAGLPKAPSTFNPLANPQRALLRRNWIIGRMRYLGYIDDLAAEAAIDAPITATYHGFQLELDAPYVAEMARQEALDLVGPPAYTDGYQVFVTVDSRLQTIARQAVIHGVLVFDKRHGYRGPEKSLSDEGTWRQVLDQTQEINGLKPAIVTGIDETEASILLANGERAVLTLDPGMKGLRRFHSQNSTTSVKTIAEVLKRGDLIRVEADPDGFWRLAQLPEAQALLVSLDPKNGAIRALIGGFSFSLSRFNRVTQALRQPGSSFKPFIYTAALENGFTPATLVNDAPVVFDDSGLENAWRPENDSGKFYGPTRLRKALYLSRNLVSIRVLRELGVERAISGMSRFGFDESALPKNLSLALGSHAVKPLQMAAAFATFANNGYRITPYLVDRIVDINGEILFAARPKTVCVDCVNASPEDAEALPATGTNHAADNEDGGAPRIGDNSLNGLEDLMTELGPDRAGVTSATSLTDYPPAPRVLDPRIVYIMDSILKDVIRQGTGRRARSLKRDDIAGKTGTTNGPRDAWFSGYSPHLVTTTWLGFDDYKVLGRHEFGGTAALPIWMEYMSQALQGLPEIHYPQPEGLVTVRIDPETGTRVGAENSKAIFEIFRKELLPPTGGNSIGATSRSKPPPLPEDLF